MYLDITVRLWTLNEKLYIFAIICHRIILGIRQFWDHVTNESLYHLTDQVSLRERKLKFIGHCIRIPTDDLINCFLISLHDLFLFSLFTSQLVHFCLTYINLTVPIIHVDINETWYNWIQIMNHRTKSGPK